MNKYLQRVAGLFLVLAVLITTGQGCSGSSVAEQAAAERVEITVWRVFDDDTTFRQIMDDYRTLHPNVSFVYRKMRIDEYKDDLVRAFAEGTGPDVFSVHNSWVGEMESLMQPMPRSVNIPFVEVKGRIKQERIVTLREIAMPTRKQVRDQFVDAVAEDAIRIHQSNPNIDPTEEIFGLPMAVDTLAMFYNRDLFNAAGIAEPPSTWEQFIKDVPLMTNVSDNDQILQSGAALGTGKNVERAFDILSLLMMQTGTQMTDERGRTAFSRPDRNQKLPAASALRFYAEFANPLKDTYTWNSAQPNSFDAFVSGKTAVFFGYSYHIPLIKARSQKLRFEVAPIPQIAEALEVNYANYWLESVSKTTENGNWAWDFIRFATSAEQVNSYLETARKPTARRALIKEQLEDEELSIFANQLLTSKSWYRGNDADVAEAAIIDLINDAQGLDEEDLDDPLKQAASKVNQTL